MDLILYYDIGRIADRKVDDVQICNMFLRTFEN